MNKNDWYEDRILWRVGKLHLESYLWKDFEMMNSLAAKTVLKMMAEGEVPLVIFWRCSEKWTLLTNQYLRGRIDGVFASVLLDDVSDVLTVNDKNTPPNEFKREAEYFSVGKDKIIFWTPKGAPHFSLRNILGMFPLNAPI